LRFPAVDEVLDGCHGGHAPTVGEASDDERGAQSPGLIE
jgi:hypothetical protein